jgi:hypothetical protein
MKTGTKAELAVDEALEVLKQSAGYTLPLEARGLLVAAFESYAEQVERETLERAAKQLYALWQDKRMCWGCWLAANDVWKEKIRDTQPVWGEMKITKPEGMTDDEVLEEIKKQTSPSEIVRWFKEESKGTGADDERT